jgi:hypothetical protein
MKFYIYLFMLLAAISCNSKPQTGNVTATTTATDTPSVSAVPQVASSSADCKRVGKVIDKFEQNNALFERLQNKETEQEWLKITTKDGGCKIVDSIGNANHYSCKFEDWDKDGFKDRIDQSKWFYEVYLFNVKANDFSNYISGVFNGDQWDYDKAKGLKYQFIEGKMGGKYELYKIKDLKKLLYCEISLKDPSGDGDKYEIEVANKKGGTEESLDRVVLKTDPTLIKAAKSLDGEEYQDWSNRVKAAVEAYWRKNEAVFLPK